MGLSAKDYGLTSPIYYNTSSGTLIKTGYGRLRGIFVATSTGTATITLYDNTTAGVPLLVNAFPTGSATYYDMGDVSFVTGCYASIDGTLDMTAFYF
jgi:hypothetical protein